MKVHRIVCFIVDLDGLGSEGVIEQLELTQYGNHAPAPRIVNIQSAEIEWSDDHPLNSVPSSRSARQAYENLFNRKDEWTV